MESNLWMCFQTFANIEINEEKMKLLNEDQKKNLHDCCPRNVFDCSINDSKITIANPQDCIFCDECMVYAREIDVPNLIKVVPRNDKFLFKVESTGVLKPLDIVKNGLDEMRKKFQGLLDALNEN